MKTTASKNPSFSLNQLRQFTSDIVRYPTIFNDVIYTPGVQYLAEHGQAYWLIDAIASFVHSIDVMNFGTRIDLQFWQLTVNNESGILRAFADSHQVPFITQPLENVDFPLSEVWIWAESHQRQWTLYLPSER